MPTIARPASNAKIPFDEMTALYQLNYHLIPCADEDGRKPVRRKWNEPKFKRMPLETCFDLMSKKGSAVYGIRLDNLAVVDCDTDNEETNALIRERFLRTDFQVRTSRGMHYYFRPGDALPADIESGNVKINFKSGTSHYVVGPGSIRPDGAVYELVADSIDLLLTVPRFLDLQERSPILQTEVSRSSDLDRSDGKVPVGRRNKILVKIAYECAPRVSCADDLKQYLLAYANTNCADRPSLPDAEIINIGDWAWSLRCNNRLFHGRLSAFHFPRPALDIICSADHWAANAALLYCRLLEAHGHEPGKVFAIAVEAMCCNGLLPYCASTADRARATLRNLGLIQLVHKGGFKEPDQYRLVNSLVLNDY